MFKRPTKQGFLLLEKLETLNDFLDEKITEAILQISNRKLTKLEARKSVLLVQISNAIEQLGDLGEDLSKISKDVFEVGASMSYESIEAVENIDELLAEKGIKNPTDMHREAYSRDFTANTLMFSPDYKQEIDITGRAKKDIQGLFLECPVSCDVSFRSDPKRILRAYYFKAKYGFNLSINTKRAIKKNLPLLSTINRRYSAEMLNKIIRESKEMLNVLIEDGALQYLPMTKLLGQQLVESKRLLDI